MRLAQIQAELTKHGIPEATILQHPTPAHGITVYRTPEHNGCTISFLIQYGELFTKNGNGVSATRVKGQYINDNCCMIANAPLQTAIDRVLNNPPHTWYESTVFNGRFPNDR